MARAHPRAARGRTLPKPVSPTNTPSSAAVTRMRLQAATGMAMSHAALTLDSAVGRSAHAQQCTLFQLASWPLRQALRRDMCAWAKSLVMLKTQALALAAQNDLPYGR